MLIQAKSTQKPQSDQQGAKRFEFNTAERLTKLPAYLALMIVGIATYIRSITTVQAGSPQLAEGRKDGDDDGAAPKSDQVAQIDDLALPGVDETETGSTDGGGRRGSLGIEQGNPWPGMFEVPDFPKLHFVEPSFYQPFVRPFIPAALLDLPVNDNNVGQVSVVPTVVEPTPPTSNPDDETDGDDDGGGAGGGDKPNRAPVVLGPVRLNDVFAGQVVIIGLIHLLRGAFDPDGDTLSVRDVAVTGADVVATAQGWQITTRPGMVGPVSISYRVTDSVDWVRQEASFQIVRKMTVLGDDDDVFSGSRYDDDIDGAGGDDMIDALAGNDHVQGGDGDDHINGGDGDDVLIGGAGNDVIFGGAGNDLIRGGEGDDRLFGGEGDDTVLGEAGNDFLQGGEGDDHLDGGDGDDHLDGSAGDDRLLGGQGDDRLKGGDGKDVLDAGDGDDRLEGGGGDDVLIDGAGGDIVKGGDGDDVLVAGAGDDIMDGGDGEDTLDLSADEQGVVVDVIGDTTYSEDLGTDTVTDVEAVIGGAGDDMFIVGGKAMVLSGGRGRDTFVFEVTDVEPGLSDHVVHKILDFVVGDRVRVRDYDLDREARDAERDLFEAIYGDDNDDWLQSDIPLSVSHELIDEESWTIIMADINGDAIFDIAINIQGVALSPPDNLA